MKAPIDAQIWSDQRHPLSRTCITRRAASTIESLCGSKRSAQSLHDSRCRPESECCMCAILEQLVGVGWHSPKHHASPMVNTCTGALISSRQTWPRSSPPLPFSYPPRPFLFSSASVCGVFRFVVMDPSYAYSFGWGECPDYAPMSDEQWKARERAAFAWEIDGSSQGCWVSPECLQHYPTMPVPSGSADSAWSGSSISCPLDSGTGTSCSHAQVAAQCTDYHLLVTDFPDVSSSLQQAPQQPMAFPSSSSQQPSTQTPMLQLTTPSRTAHLPPLDTSSTSTLSPSTFCPAEHSPERTTPTEEDVDGQTIRVQQPRFEADLYTARWVRGEGTGRAGTHPDIVHARRRYRTNASTGWCGFCSTWHKLKDSAFVSRRSPIAVSMLTLP